MGDYKISLAAARTNADMTQAQVAEAMHVAKSTIIAWENGKSSPNAKQLFELLDLYKAPVSAIRVQ